MESETPLFNLLLWEGLAIIGCIILSAIFSSTETALTSLSVSRARQMRDSYGRWARVLGLWIDHPNRTLTAILIGNNLVNILASALATDLASRLFPGQAIPIAVGAMTFLILIFGEITPKVYAKHNAERIAVPALRFLQVTYYLTYPLNLLLTYFTGKLVLLSGGQIEHTGPHVTEEDIEYLIDLGTKEGSFGVERERLLQSVFDFTDLVVREIMVPRTDMKVIEIDIPAREAIEQFHLFGHSRLPVQEDSVDEIKGILYLRDLIPVLAKQPEEEDGDVREYLREPLFVPEQMKISTLLREFQTRKFHMAVVVDEFGGTSGLVTLEDVVEVIFGEIFDEYDQEWQPIKKVEEGLYLADATVSIRDLEDLLHVEFPEEGEYDTLNGFLIFSTGKVPEVGFELRWMNLAFRVKEVNPRMVEWVEIAVLTEEAESEVNGRE